MLECKRKERGKTMKTSCRLTVEQTRRLMEGKPLLEDGTLTSLHRKLNLQIQLRGMRPVVIVEYDRIPYVCKQGNVRVSFDTNISSGSDISDFLSERLPKRPVMPLGQQLMEVKYDEYLPEELVRKGFAFGVLDVETMRDTILSWKAE